jgi:hypothetical protein
MALPRPTVAQFAYGSCTVIFSALAVLPPARTASGPRIAVIAVAALVLGLLVAWRVPAPRARGARASAAAVPDEGHVPTAR